MSFVYQQLSDEMPDIGIVLGHENARHQTSRYEASLTKSACRGPFLRWSAPRHRGDDGHLRALRDGGIEALLEADILLVHVDVHEATQAPGVIEEAPSEPGVASLERLDHLRDRGPLDHGLRGPLRKRPELGGHCDLHGHASSSSRTSFTASTVGGISWVGATGPRASSVLSPIPVINA